MSQYSSLNDGYLFYSENAPSSDFLTTSYDSSGFGVLSSIGGTPTCRNTPNTGTCGVSIDLTVFVPCVSDSSTVWPVCQKPPAQAIYPAYPASDPTSDNGFFP